MADPYWTSLREQAERRHAVEKADHDANYGHVWLDVTVYGDTKKHCICKFCYAEKWKPFDVVVQFSEP